MKLTSDWQQTLRNVTETISPPFDARTEEMKRNSQNIFGLYKTLKTPFQIKWKVLKKCKPYSNISKKFNLCLYEKFIIICKKELCSLNRRNALASSCPHRNRYVLQNSGAPNDNFRKNICSEDDFRSRIFGTFVVKFLACLPLL